MLCWKLNHVSNKWTPLLSFKFPVHILVLVHGFNLLSTFSWEFPAYFYIFFIALYKKNTSPSLASPLSLSRTHTIPTVWEWVVERVSPCVCMWERESLQQRKSDQLKTSAKNKDVEESSWQLQHGRQGSKKGRAGKDCGGGLCVRREFSEEGERQWWLHPPH